MRILLLALVLLATPAYAEDPRVTIAKKHTNMNQELMDSFIIRFDDNAFEGNRSRYLGFTFKWEGRVYIYLRSNVHPEIIAHEFGHWNTDPKYGEIPTDSFKFKVHSERVARKTQAEFTRRRYKYIIETWSNKKLNK